MIYALILSLSMNVLFAALVFRVVSSSSDRLDRAHARTTEYTTDLVDRLAARDWASWWEMAHPTVERMDEEIETDETYVPTLGADRGGFGSRLGLRAYGPVEDEIDPEREMP